MKQYTYNKPAGFYPETRVGRYRCDVSGCGQWATWKLISGPDRDQDLRWLCQMHKDLADGSPSPRQHRLTNATQTWTPPTAE